MAGARTYDLLYRSWAPWDRVGVRTELRAVLDRGDVAPHTHPRAIDLGCGTGANAVHLAEQGFDVTGIDFSRVAVAEAQARARRAGVEARCRFLEADLTAADLLDGEDTTFDLVLDASTLDDLDPAGRAVLAGHIARLARPGATFLCWCFYARRRDLPLISFTGPSRVTPAIEPGEEHALFGASFELVGRQRHGRHEAFLELRRHG
jgi:SAM-dependent methyltransferase